MASARAARALSLHVQLAAHTGAALGPRTAAITTTSMTKLPNMLRPTLRLGNIYTQEYSTTAPETTPAVRVDPALARAAVQTPALKASGKPFPLEKRYKYMLYSTMLVNSKVVALYQALSPKGEEYRAFKQACERSGLVCLMVNTKIFKKALENYFNTLGHLGKEIIDSERRMQISDLKLLSNLASSHTVLVFSPAIKPEGYYAMAQEKRAPIDSNHISSSLKFVLDKKNIESFPKMFLIGGKVEHKAFSLADFKSLVTLPNIDQLRGQILGLLQSYSAIPAVLSSPPFNVALTLQALESQMKDAEAPKADATTEKTDDNPKSA